MTSGDGHSEANHPPGLVNGEARELKTMVDKVVFIVSGADNTGIICIVSSSLQESRLTLASAMRERLTQNIAVLTVIVTRTLRRLRQNVRSVE